jgi:Mrp family chromosome partitioning ATPase/uncharacterized protein involved in exopolysaccharide biosynthesis
MTQLEPNLLPSGASNNLAAAPNLDQEATRRRQRILALFRGRYHWVFALSAILGLAGALLGYFREPPIFTSVGTVRIEPRIPSVMSSTEGKNVPPMWTEYIGTQVVQMKSRGVIELALEDEDWRNAAGAEADNPNRFASSLTAAREKGTYLITVFFEDEDRNIAYAGARAAIKAYIALHGQQGEQQDSQILSVLEERRSSLNRELKNLIDRRNVLASEYGSDNLSTQYNFKLEEMQNYESMLNKVDIALAAAGAGEGVATPLSELTVEQLATIDSVIAELIQQQQYVVDQIRMKKEMGLGDNHRDVLQHTHALTLLNEKIQAQARALREGQLAPKGSTSTTDSFGLGTDVEQLRIKKLELQKLYDKAKAETVDLGKKQMQIQQLNENIETVKHDLGDTEENIGTRTLEAAISGRVIVTDLGSMPKKPSNAPKRKKLAVLGALAGISLGVGVVMLIGVFDRRLRHIDDAHTDLPSARLLGILPTLPTDLHDPEQALLVSHSVHHIRTLLQIGRDPTGLVFSITGPASGSGKTSLTIALGLSFAASGARTLIIDADVVGGGLSRRIGVSVHPRLGEILRDQNIVGEQDIEEALKVGRITGKRIGEALVDLGYATDSQVDAAVKRQAATSVGLLEAANGQPITSCVAPTRTENLYILPIGTALPHHAGALSPKALRRLIADARAQFDTVLIDTGPILGSLEASLAAAEADGTIMIVSRGDQKPAIHKCIEQLNAINAKLTGIVFNHATDADIARSTYASVTVSQNRSPLRQLAAEAIDPETSARYGPVATAVASFAGSPEIIDQPAASKSA